MRYLIYPAIVLGFSAAGAAAQTTAAPAPTAAPAQPTAPVPSSAPAQAGAPAQPTAGQQANAPAAAGTAAAPANPTVGAAVYGAGGAQVGTVESVTPQGVVINTGTSKVAVPTASIGTGPSGLTVSLTKDQLTAAAAQAQAQGAASLTAGASVKSSDGTSVGTVKAVDGEFVTLTTSKGADVRLPKSGIANGPTGAVIGMTSAQFDAATAGAAPAAGALGGAAAGADAATTSSSTTTTSKKTTRRR